MQLSLNSSAPLAAIVEHTTSVSAYVFLLMFHYNANHQETYTYTQHHDDNN